MTKIRYLKINEIKHANGKIYYKAYAYINWLDMFFNIPCVHSDFNNNIESAIKEIESKITYRKVESKTVYKYKLDA